MYPKVNVVLSTYNGERFLREQLDSLLPVQEEIEQEVSELKEKRRELREKRDELTQRQP